MKAQTMLDRIDMRHPDEDGPYRYIQRPQGGKAKSFLKGCKGWGLWSPKKTKRFCRAKAA